MDYLILSNNSSLEDNVAGLPVKHIAGGLSEFYEAVSQALQNGYELLTSLIPPNVPLIRSPLRSAILLGVARQYDARGLLELERARERTRTLGVNDVPRIRKDLEFIDRDHLICAIGQLHELALLERGCQTGNNIPDFAQPHQVKEPPIRH